MDSIDKQAETVQRAIESLSLPEPDDEKIEALDRKAITELPSADPLGAPKSWDIFEGDDAVAIDANVAEVPGLSGTAGRERFVVAFLAHVSHCHPSSS